MILYAGVSVACCSLYHRLWSWGWGVHGQLGLESVDNKLLPTHASLLDAWQVSFISAGYGHSAVLTAEVMSNVSWQCSRNSQCGFCVMYFLSHKPPLQEYPILNYMYIFLLISFIQGKVLTFGNGTLVLSYSKLVSMHVCTNKYVMITLIMSLLQQKKTKKHFLITYVLSSGHTYLL